MKKTIIRIVAVAMLALMVLTALPAFAYNIVGTAAAQTPVYKDTKGRKVELYVSGPVTINRQDNKSGMYNVTVSYDGKTYTGWVYPSAISGIGYDKSTGGSASGSTSGTTGRGGHKRQRRQLPRKRGWQHQRQLPRCGRHSGKRDRRQRHRLGSRLLPLRL